MQDPSCFPPIKPQFPEQEQLKCPRCESSNTKFCYYNNYNLSQPRHFCKNCRRYWTKGGALRNVPVGGGTRKNPKKPSPVTAKKPSSSLVPANPNPGLDDPTRIYNPGSEPDRRILEISGSFSSLLAGVDPNSGVKMVEFGEFAENLGTGSGRESGMETGNWVGGGNGWPDLAIYTPGSSYQ